MQELSQGAEELELPQFLEVLAKCPGSFQAREDILDAFRAFDRADSGKISQGWSTLTRSCFTTQTNSHTNVPPAETQQQARHPANTPPLTHPTNTKKKTKQTHTHTHSLSLSLPLWWLLLSRSEIHSEQPGRRHDTN